MVAVYRKRPKGPNGYASDYQIKVTNDPPGSLMLFVVVKGQVRRLGIGGEDILKRIRDGQRLIHEAK
jgi:hypothetical protein